MSPTKPLIEPASFRDPSGCVFTHNGMLYRQVNKAYAVDYDACVTTGLFDTLFERQLLVKHREVTDIPVPRPDLLYKTLAPAMVPFVSYPYEWCFSQLKTAATCTLQVQEAALERGMILKDASAYNIQFVGSKPLFIDTLSFERHTQGQPWAAYRQFCMHFLAPLLLMAYRGQEMGALLTTLIDGIELGLTSRLLPRFTFLVPGILLHVHLHSLMERKVKSAPSRKRGPGMGEHALVGFVRSLRKTVRRCRLSIPKTQWVAYHGASSYTDATTEHKKAILKSFLETVNPKTVWDLGGNTGVYSRLAASRAATVVCFDNDRAVVETCYRAVVKGGDERILALVMDMTNPSSAIGWHNSERKSLLDRGPADMALALALIHHISVGNNVPFSMSAAFFRQLCRHLAIEFVPATDTQVQGMLMRKPPIYGWYTREEFEREYARHFTLLSSQELRESGRILYLMRRT